MPEQEQPRAKPQELELEKSEQPSLALAQTEI